MSRSIPPQDSDRNSSIKVHVPLTQNYRYEREFLNQFTLQMSKFAGMYDEKILRGPCKEFNL